MQDKKIRQERLLSLIEFAQQSARLKLSTIKEIRSHKLFSKFEHELIGLPGIHFNQENNQDEIWFVINRLLESRAPHVNNQELAIWLNLSNDPNAIPFLKDSVTLLEITAHNDDTVTKKNIKKDEVVFFSDYENKDLVINLFEKYIKKYWEPWSIEEKKRRSTIKLYSELFTLKQQIEGGITDAQIEFVLGIGISIWKKEEFKITYPLIIQVMDIQINRLDMSIEIRPRRSLDAKFDLDIYASIDNPFVSEIEEMSKKIISSESQFFSPFVRTTFESKLQLAATHLDPQGMYWPSQTTSEDRNLPIHTEELKVTDTWVLFARPRSKSLFIQDLENFKKGISEECEILSVVNEIISDPSSEHREKKLPSFRGLSTSNIDIIESDLVSDLFFPLPHNEEQVSIIKNLECSSGVVVQGPPGTGKTHTIANVISHYMANGKRVLVTSMKEHALTVLKNKLPEKIQPLVISLLTNDQDSKKQFEFAISKIVQKLSRINIRELENKIKVLEEEIDRLHSVIAGVDRQILQWAKNNIQPFFMDGDQLQPKNAAEEVAKFINDYVLIEDPISIDSSNKPQFTNADIIRLRDARKNVSEHIDYIGKTLPELSQLPNIIELIKIHNDLLNYNNALTFMKDSKLPIIFNVDEQFNTEEVVEKIKEWLKIDNDLKNVDSNLIKSFSSLLSDDDSKQILDIFESIANEVNLNIAAQNIFLLNPIHWPDNLIISPDIIQAIRNKAKNKPAFGVSGFLLKNKLNKKINSIKIVDSIPKTIEDWRHIYDYVILQHQAKQIMLRWNNIAKEIPISVLDEHKVNFSLKIAKSELTVFTQIKKLYFLKKYIFENIKIILYEYVKEIEDMNLSDFFSLILSILERNININKLSASIKAKQEIQNKLSQYSGHISTLMNKMIIELLGNHEVGEPILQEKWSALLAELQKVHDLRDYFDDIIEICEKIRLSGAELWARKLEKEPVHSTVDLLLPDNWESIWRVTRLHNYLKNINDFEKFTRLSRERPALERTLSDVYQKVVANRTWLKLAINATPDIRTALQSFYAAIMKIGSGNGKRAVRYRRDARDAAALANKAIPCWIMPHYRISESLPPEFGCFDLVIIDEASQSDLTALPAILRGKKILIVGDDKQVSPEGIGLEEEKINSLMKQFLSNQVPLYRQAMSPERSMYDLCKIVFSDSQIMLREHFRCVSPIIEYSKREFYNHEIRPLRLPTSSERLDPPLIDVFIEDGCRKDKEKINIPEARFIVNEIAKICADRLMDEKTIGIVSLLGYQQAVKIWEMIQKECSPEDIVKHQITCGDAFTFQGKERDIIFLSMVVTKDNNRAMTNKGMQQRFNVAGSRARDRMYLVRSIEIDELSLADELRIKLIQHFMHPFGQDEVRTKTLRELCESPFELEFYDLLTEQGYKVTPQVKVGSFRIDMVVEGYNDARLAIECDGDRYHNASNWEADMNRQRILERAGWKFWRCFSSTFILRKAEVIQDLMNTLTELGIEPIGNNFEIQSIYSEHRRITINSLLEATKGVF